MQISPVIQIMSLILVFFCLNLRFNQNILHCIYLLFSLSCFTLEQSSHLFFGGVIDNIDIFRIQVKFKEYTALYFDAYKNNHLFTAN